MKPSSLTPDQFQKWRLKQGMSIAACAKRLGISPGSVTLYEAGERNGRPVAVPVLVALGMSAINNNLKPYEVLYQPMKEEENDSDTSNTGIAEPAGQG